MSLRRTAIAVGAFLLAPAAAWSQQQPPAEVQQMVAEMEQIQTELAPLQQQALQDEALMGLQEKLMDSVREAMIAADPATEERLNRMESLMEEAAAAQAAGDAEKIVQLTQEARTLQPQIMQAQEAVLEQPAIAGQLEGFQASLRAKMIELSPESRAKLDRLDTLQKQVLAIMADGA